MLNNTTAQNGLKIIVKRTAWTALGLLVGATLFLIAYNYYFGKVGITLESDGISYKIDTSQKTYNKESVINWVTPGKHQVSAFGAAGVFYKAKTFSIIVDSGQTTTLDIALEPAKTDDTSGVSFDSNSLASDALKEKLPLAVANVGSIYYDYSEEQYHVDLLGNVSHEAALSWFLGQGVAIDDISVTWGLFNPPD